MAVEAARELRPTLGLWQGVALYAGSVLVLLSMAAAISCCAGR